MLFNSFFINSLFSSLNFTQLGKCHLVQACVKDYMSIARKHDKEVIGPILLLQRSTTLLNIATRNNNFKMTKQLLLNGANVNTLDRVGMTPAMCAAKESCIDIMKLYLKNGLKINQKCEDGWTALHWCAIHGAKKVAQLLINHGADVNASNFQGEKASYIADFYGHEELAELLHRYEYNNKNQHCLFFDKEFFEKFPHIVENIFSFLDYQSYKTCINVNTQWRELLTSKRYMNMTKLLFSSQICYDESKFVTAVHKSEIDKVKRLLSSGMIDANCINGTGNYYLRSQCECKYHNINLVFNITCNRCKSNFDRARPMITYEKSTTPLNLSARNGNLELSQLLLENGADVNIADEKSCTPLYTAAKYGHSNVLRLFLENGADPNKQDRNGITPLCITQIRGEEEMSLILKNFGAVSSEPSWIFFYYRDAYWYRGVNGLP